MKKIIEKLFFASLLLLLAATDVTAQVDLQKSFGAMCKDGNDFMFAEGGNWKITFSATDSLGNEYDKPVQMVFNGALFKENVAYYLEEVDSLLFKLPETEYAAGVFEIGEELFNYIVESDSLHTIYFRIDCLTKTKVPKIGQKVICNIYRGKLPYGFMGRVENMRADYSKGWVEMRCGTLPLEDIFDVLYTGGVTGVQGSDEVPDSLIEKKEVRKRIVTRAQSEVLDTVVSWGDSKELDKKIVITEKGEIKEDEEEGPLVISLEGEAALAAHFSAIIDKAQSIKKIRCTVDASITGKVSVDADVEISPDENDKTSLDFASVKVPIVVLPGVTANVDFGLTWDYKLEAQLHAEAEFGISRTAGIDIDGLNREVVWVDNNENNNSNPLNFSSGASGEVSLSGEFFVALHTKVGVGIAGEGVSFMLKFGTGPKVSGQLTYKFGQRDYDLYDVPEWLAEREELYKGLNEGTFFLVEWGLLFDVEFSVGYDAWSFSASEWMEKVGLENTAFFEIYRLNAAPSTETIDDRKLAEGYYSGTLKNEYGLIFPYDLNMLFLDISPGVEPDGQFEYLHEGAGRFNAIRKKDVSFKFDISNEPLLKGRKIGVYPVLFNSFFTGNLVMGQFDEFYQPYKVKFTEYEKDYERADIVAEFDADAVSNPYITEGGIIFVDVETGDVLKTEKIFENRRPDSNVMQTSATRGVFPRDEFNVKAYIYDSVNDVYMYSNSWPGGFFEYYAPTTKDATEITAVGATLNADLHSSIYEAEDMNHVDNRFSVGFTYSPKGTTVMDHLNNVRLVGYELSLDGKLQPDTEYFFNAVVKDNETGKTYKGLQTSFRTKPVFYGVEGDANHTNVIFFAKLDKGFGNISDKGKYKFLVSENRLLIDAGEVIEVEPEDITRDSDEDDYDITVEEDNRWEREKIYYVKVVYDDGNGTKHESSVEEFRLPPPIDNLEAKPASESALLSADVLKDYANGDAKIVLEYSTLNKDFVENAQSEDITEDITWIEPSPGVFEMNYELNDLSPSTTYYYRYKLYVEVNDVDVEIYTTPIHLFKTLKLQLMATTMASTVTKNRVTMTGSVTRQLQERLEQSVTNKGDEQYMIYFEVSKNKDMSEAVVTYVPYNGECEYSAELRNLAWNTKYYYRFVAMTANDKKLYRGAIKSFSVEKEPLDNYDLETFPAVLDDEWTILRGKVNSNVLESIDAKEYDDMYIGFEYSFSVVDLNEGNENVYRDGAVTLNMNTGYCSQPLNLMPDTKYYYRIFVYAAGKFTYGNIEEFTTPYYDAGLIIPSKAKRRRGIEAVTSENGANDRIVIFDNGKMIIPEEDETDNIAE